MQKDLVSVLDFGSSKITVVCGTKNVNDNFNIVATGECDYAGYIDGEFLEPEMLKNAIATAINNAQMNMKNKITKLYVGIPAEFCVNSIQDVNISFKSKTKLKPRVIANLFSDNEVNNYAETHTIINKSPIYYLLDGDNKLIDPVGVEANSLMVKTSFIYVENRVIQMLNSVFVSLGLKNIEYLSSTLAEGLYLLNTQTRYKGAVLVDVGYVSTSVCSIMGDGIIDLKSFSLGGAHITSDLSEILNIPFLQAEQLKRKLILTLKPTAIDYYEIMLDGKLTKVPVKTANDIALARIDMISEMIEKVIKSFSLKPINANIIYLTGGGLALLKGIKYYLNKTIGKKIEIVCPKPMQLEKPELSSVVSLLDMAININKIW